MVVLSLQRVGSKIVAVPRESAIPKSAEAAGGQDIAESFKFSIIRRDKNGSRLFLAQCRVKPGKYYSVEQAAYLTHMRKADWHALATPTTSMRTIRVPSIIEGGGS